MLRALDSWYKKTVPQRVQEFREICLACDAFSELRCLRCGRFGCDSHRGNEDDRRCDICEDEFLNRATSGVDRSARRQLVGAGLVVTTLAAFFPTGGYAWGAVPTVVGLGAFLAGIALLDGGPTARQRFLAERLRARPTDTDDSGGEPIA